MLTPQDLLRNPQLLEQIAKVCHETNRAYAETIGEVKQSWENAPETIRASAREGITHFVGRGGSVSHAEQHEAWLAAKLRDGWRYGPVLDNEAKTHPNMLPYTSLPEAQRRKDALFQAVITALTSAL